MLAIVAAGIALGPRAAGAAEGDPDARSLPPISVVGQAPLPGIGVDRDSLPYTVQTAHGSELSGSANGSLVELLLGRMSGVNVSDVQGSPFQRDLSYRGYSASSLIGAAQGISVFLDGVRFNAPFGDVVSWDLVPEFALRDITLVGGANPVYGLNSLGGALALTTRSGLDSPGFDADLRVGRFGRKRADLAWGGSDDAGNHAFVAGTYFDEDGWRDHSQGHLGNLFAKVGRNSGSDSIEATLLYGTSRLTGNGLVPDLDYADDGAVAAMGKDRRSAVYTWPDRTRNTLWQGAVNARHAFTPDIALDGMLFARYARRDTVNGDVAEDYEAYVDACGAGFDDDGNPLSDDCPVTRDEGAAIPPAVLNTTSTREHSWGGTLALSGSTGAHRWTTGLDYVHASVSYDQYQQEASFDESRGVQALPGAPVDFFSGVDGGSRTWGLYATDTFEVVPRTFLTGALRYNHARVDSELSVGDDGAQPRNTFNYSKLNPALGIVHQFGSGLSLYGNASQGNRVPTVIELGCADPAAPCRLPAGLQSDPPLDQVVTRSYEVGARWRGGATSATLAVYRNDNRDDILFLRAPDTQQGYFANFPRTRNQGVDASLDTALGAFSVGLRYSFLQATYQAEGVLASGERTIDVHPGMRIAGLPRHTFKLTADWKPVAPLLVGIDMVAVSRVVTAGNEDGLVADPGDEGATPVDAHVAGHAVFNLRGSWHVDRHLAFYGGVANLFDTRYANYAAIGDDLFPGGMLVAPHVEPGEAPPARFVAPGAPRAWYAGLRYTY